MFLKIDPKSGTPVYLQIIEQIKSQIASGRLRIGDRLPTVRDLAVDLRVNPNTVSKAYRELERDNVLEGRPGIGSFVSGKVSGLVLKRKEEEVRRHMERAVVEAYHLQLQRRQITGIFTETLDGIYPPEGAEGGKGGRT